MAESYTIVNRTSKKIEGVWDGRHYELAPHESRQFDELICYAFKKQNLQLGSLDPRSGAVTFLVGIKELGDPCDPLKQEILINPKTGKPEVEIWNREHLTGSRPSEVVPGDNGLYQVKEWKRGQDSEVIGFVDPEGK